MSRLTTDARTRPNSVRKRVRFVNRFIGYLMISTAWTRLVVRPKVEGRKNLKGIDGPLLILLNHKSYYDIPAIAGIIVRYRRDISFMAMAELFSSLVVRSVLTWFGTIPVFRGTDRATEALPQGIKVLRARGVLIVFVEGKMSRTDELLPGKYGAAYMALTAGATVVVAAMYGTQHVMNPSTKKVRLRQRYAVVIGEPFKVERQLTHEPTQGECAHLTTDIMDRMAVLFKRAKVLVAE